MKRPMVKLLASAALATGIALPQQAGASPITAYESIVDLSGSHTDMTRDLQRVRQVGADPATLENADATIIAENAIDLDFGVWNSSAVSYSHQLAWLVPGPGNLLSATLTIAAYNARGENDTVWFDTVNLIGSLTPNNNGVSITAFNGTATLLASLLDGTLQITIDKQPDNENENSKITILSSRLDVAYETRGSQTTVPEPATVMLVGSGVLAIASRRRQRGRRTSTASA